MLTLCGLGALIHDRISQTHMRTPMEGYRHTTVPAWRVDLNQALEDELAALPGVGPSLAAAIVADRRTHGAYATLSQLDRVPGVGPSVLEQIKPFVLQSP